VWKLAKLTAAFGAPAGIASTARHWRSLQDGNAGDISWPDDSPVKSFAELLQIAERAALFKGKANLEVVRKWHVEHGFLGGIVSRCLRPEAQEKRDTARRPPVDAEASSDDVKSFGYYLYYELEPNGRLVQQVFVRGTSGAADLKDDFETKKVWDEELQCYFHSGFLRRANTVLQDLEPLLQRTSSLSLSGHSLGGAVAAIVGLKLKRRGYQVESVVSFGAPKFTTADAVAVFQELPLLRVCHEDDVVVGLPPTSFFNAFAVTWTGIYQHVGRQLLLGSEPGEACFLSGETACQWWNQSAWFMLSSHMIRSHRMPTYAARIQELRDGRASLLPYNACGGRRWKRDFLDQRISAASLTWLAPDVPSFCE